MKLKNYAAPRGYGYGQSFSATKETTLLSSPKLTPLVLTLTSASPTISSFVRSSGSSPPPESHSVPNLRLNTSLGMSSPTLSTISTTTSRDSTPVHTPTRGDEEDGEEGWKVGGEGEEGWSLDGHFTPGDRNTTFSYTSYPKSGDEEMVRGEEKKESAYESTNGGGGSGLMPPQRRRRGNGTSSSSASDSNSKSSTLPSPSTSTPPPIPFLTTATSITPKQKPKLPKLDVHSPTSVTSPSGIQSPYPRQGLGYNSPPQPQKHGHQSMPSSVTTSNSKSPSSPEDSDAIYQALVREWCFAQGSSNSTSGGTTSVIVKSSSPLGLDDGE